MADQSEFLCCCDSLFES
uniref:Uncharacterized protein n=1 Tax=Rhizophora mucronata TaxID=61149 RepID=A0A2P2N2V7_RHIMU